MLVTKEKGLTAFIFANGVENAEDSQDLLYYQINNTLIKYESLRSGRNVVISPNVITFFSQTTHPESTEEYLYCDSSNLKDTIEALSSFDQKYYSVLCEFLQKFSSMKQKNKRKMS